MAVKNYKANQQLTAHFNSSEFMCKCGCKQIKVDDRLLVMLETLFDKCNAKSITITSGYRCPSYDKRIGGFAGQHSKGKAADIKIKGQDGNYISTKIISCIAQDEFAKDGAGIANINSTYTAIHIDSRLGSVYRGNEIISNNSVTRDFYDYYKIDKGDINLVTGEVKTDTTHDIIKGICQMPNPNGEGFLLGIETFDNPNKSYRYEILIYDCSKQAWISSTGKCFSNSNCLWWNWKPEYGYYWTLFRVYDVNDNVIDEECYGFQNI